MGLVLNEDEKLLQESAEGFFIDKSPVKNLRALRDNRDETGFDKGLWQEMADMGFTGVLIDEDHGGVDMGFMAAGLIAEHMGRNLAASPFISTSVLAVTALNTAGSREQKQAWLPEIASGKALIALAVDEGRKHAPGKIEMTAERSGNGFKLNGSKAMVIDGHVADRLIVAAKTSENKLTLFLLDPKTKGVDIERTIMIDSRNAARVEFKDVNVTADAVLGEVDGGNDVLKSILTAGRAVISAELYGVSDAAFKITTDYIRERKQFGTEIGRFQALQHRSSHLYTELEIAKSAVLASLTALDAGDVNAEKYVKMTKAKVGQVAKLAGLEGVQMHGGVGMTDEYDIGLYLKRIRVAQELFGDTHFHMEEIARASGF